MVLNPERNYYVCLGKNDFINEEHNFNGLTIKGRKKSRNFRHKDNNLRQESKFKISKISMTT